MRSVCGAGKKSLSRIRAALSETQDAMGVTALNDWTARYYQHANRLAVLHFLTCHSIPVVLVDVFFHGRTDSDDRSPNTPEEWEPVLSERSEYLGLTGESELEKRVFHAFIDISGAR